MVTINQQEQPSQMPSQVMELNGKMLMVMGMVTIHLVPKETNSLTTQLDGKIVIQMVMTKMKMISRTTQLSGTILMVMGMVTIRTVTVQMLSPTIQLNG